ncbi:MAG: sorbosone dehydrogenase family protein, partial [Alphaproteobacteria bacterium]|nr:sorbosone dehydrogenase family protein [Alphaproteobacteria bacterium]
MSILKQSLAQTVAIVFAAHTASAQVQTDVGYGANPKLPPPRENLLMPTVKVSKAVGWAEGNKPKVADGLEVSLYASGFDHPRWLYKLPNGDVLVAESNAPPSDRSGEKFSFTTWVRRLIMGRVGAGVTSANRISLLRDADGDGVAETKTVFLEGLFSPIGMALVGSDLYVGNANALMRFPYVEGATSITDPGTKVTDLPGGPIYGHWTRNVIASADGSKIYVAVGSTGNIADDGYDKETNRANILEVDRATGQFRVFAGGLRNPVGLAWEPVTGMLWTTVNERDLLGTDLVPDYMTSVQDGAFYGWPFSYFGQNVDERVSPQRPDLVAKSISPDYGLGAHTASLGIHFYQGELLPADY